MSIVSPFKKKILPVLLFSVSMVCNGSLFAMDDNAPMHPYVPEGSRRIVFNPIPKGASKFDLSSPKLKSTMERIYVGYEKINTVSLETLKEHKELLNYKKRCLHSIVDKIYTDASYNTLVDLLDFVEDKISINGKEFLKSDIRTCVDEKKKQNFILDCKAHSIAAIEKAFLEGKRIVLKNGLFFVMSSSANQKEDIFDDTHLSYSMQPKDTRGPLLQSSVYDSRKHFNELELKRADVEKEFLCIMSEFESNKSISNLLDCSYGDYDLKKYKKNFFDNVPFLKDGALKHYFSSAVRQKEEVWSDRLPFIALSKFFDKKFKLNGTIKVYEDLINELNEKINNLESDDDYIQDCEFGEQINVMKANKEDHNKIEDIVSKKKITSKEIRKKIKIKNSAKNAVEKWYESLENAEKKYEELRPTLREFLGAHVYASIVAKELSLRIKKCFFGMTTAKLEYVYTKGGFYAFFPEDAVPISSKVKKEELGGTHFELFQCLGLEQQNFVNGCYKQSPLLDSVDVNVVVPKLFCANPKFEAMMVFAEELKI